MSRLVDPRGLRFAAAVTAIVLALVIVTGNGWLLAAQAGVFAVGAALGLRYAPYGALFRVGVAARLRSPVEREPEGPPRFAQALGFVFAAVGLAGYAAGVTWLFFVATAFAWVAAFLNAAFGFCLGCEFYLLFRRVLPIRKGVPA